MTGESTDNSGLSPLGLLLSLFLLPGKIVQWLMYHNTQGKSYGEIVENTRKSKSRLMTYVYSIAAWLLISMNIISMQDTEAEITDPTQGKPHKAASAYPQSSNEIDIQSISNPVALPDDIGPSESIATGTLVAPMRMPKTPKEYENSAREDQRSPGMREQLYVQVAALSSRNSAEHLQDELRSLSSSRVQSAVVNGQHFFRVQLGPFFSEDAANAAIKQLETLGHKSARIVRD